MIADAQTSGGLLLSCNEKNVNNFISKMNDEGNFAKVIGYITENGDQYWAYFSQIEKDI